MGQLKFTGETLGKEYSGTDQGQHITVLKDQTFKVSAEKEKQLLADFPKDFLRETETETATDAREPEELPKQKKKK